MLLHLVIGIIESLLNSTYKFSPPLLHLRTPEQINLAFTALSNSLEQREKKVGEEGVLVETATVAIPMFDVAYLGLQIKSLRWLPRRGTGDAVAGISQDNQEI